MKSHIAKLWAKILVLVAIFGGISGYAGYHSLQETQQPTPQIITIEGPRAEVEGKLVVLKTNAIKFVWVHNLKSFVECPNHIALVPEIGTNTIWLVHELDGKLLRLKHEVQVVRQGGSPPDVPERPTIDDRPTKDTQPQFDQSAILKAARGLQDEETTRLLVTEWKSTVGGIRSSPNLDGAKQLLKQANDTAFSKRTSFSSRYKDWLGLFRKPLSDEIERLILKGDIKSPADLARYIEQLIAAL